MQWRHLRIGCVDRSAGEAVGDPFIFDPVADVEAVSASAPPAVSRRQFATSIQMFGHRPRSKCDDPAVTSPCSAADTSEHDKHWGFLSAADFPWRRAKQDASLPAPEFDVEEEEDEDLSPRCATSGWTDEVVDFEALAYMAATEYDASSFGLSRRASREMSVSGLPLVCSNCGVSFFSLQIPDDQVDCYCSGECKWSVIMYREMDRRLYALRPHARSAGSTYDSSYVSSASSSGRAAGNYFQPVDDVISCR